MKKFIAVSFAVTCITLAVACGSNGPTVSGPDPVTVSAPEPVAAPAPDPTPKPVVAPVVVDGFDLKFENNAGFNVKNTGPSARAVYAYITSFDNQSLALDSRVTPSLAAGDIFAGTFNKQCVQLDVSTESVGGRPDIGFAYFDKQGKQITPANRDVKIAECRQCDPETSRWETLETIEYGEWTEYTPVQAEAVAVACVKYERRHVIVKEKNTCSQTVRVKSDTYDTRTVPVNAPDLAITGAPAQNATGFTGQGTVLPPDGTFSPALPLQGVQPEYGQPAVTLSTTYSKTLSFGPNNQCSVSASKTFTFTLEPKSCVDQPYDTYAWASTGKLTVHIHDGDSSPNYYLFDDGIVSQGPFNYHENTNYTINNLPVDGSTLCLKRQLTPEGVKYCQPQHPDKCKDSKQGDFTVPTTVPATWENLGNNSCAVARCEGVAGAWRADLTFVCSSVKTTHHTCEQ